jgi:hypothetical protein
MDQNRGSMIVIGAILILVGGFILAVQFIPGFNIGFDIEFTWPLILVAIGLLLFLGALITNQPGLAVPAAIVGGIGGILYWQEAIGDYSSWAYAWTLIPGFVGIGIILEGILSGNFWKSLSSGGVLLLISLAMFFIFGSIFGQENLLGSYWPILLIILGVVLLGRTLYDAWRI